ncbi:MAG TPA: FtsX-like permease family protein [Flavobacteriales bacterium]|jgi:cell division transport system permease protein|nr:FtsX-like permease family protein [Flavobacteriales bacterium]HIO68798.1 FtsX-like permease family protein [Flavobacteriales bacterium]
MSTKEKIVKRRLYASSVSTIISISLVLFMLGLVGLIVLTSEKLSVMVKENIGFSIYLTEQAKEVDIIQLKKHLEATAYVKSARYITKEEAVELLQEDLDPDEDFLDILEGYNPLPASIDIILNAEFANPDSITWIEDDVAQNDLVREFKYDPNFLNLINTNVKQISMFILVFGALLFLIAMALINNTIRLVIYSQRFTIRTMQLVGATRGFIRRPFIMKGIAHGIFAGVIAIAFLVGSLYLTQREIPELIVIQDIELIGTIFGGVMVSGILISWVSTLFAVRKYLKLKTDELYF